MLRRTIAKRKDLTFVIVYTREPHARQMAFKDLHQPATWKERQALAQKTRKELKLEKALFLIDPMGDPSRKLFGDVPNPAIFVEKGGQVHDKLSWADGSEVARLLEAWRPLAVPGAKTKVEKPDRSRKKREEKDGTRGQTDLEKERRPASR